MTRLTLPLLAPLVLASAFFLSLAVAAMVCVVMEMGRVL